MESVFSFKDYRAYLQGWLENEPASHGKMTQMSRAAGCQRSYLSRVLHGHVHLTPDHAFGLCEYWKLSSLEREYFLLMVDMARASSSVYRKHLDNQLEELRRKRERLGERLERNRISSSQVEQTYYSSWHWSAIHILVSIPKFQTVKQISARLQLPERMVEETLVALEKFKLIKRSGSKWVFDSSDVHIPKESALSALHHQNWRARANLDAHLSQSDSVHYTVVQSLTEETFLKIKEKLLLFIEDQKALAGPSKEEELVCMTVDLFKV